MASTHGKTSTFFLDETNISAQVRKIDIATSVELADDTPLGANSVSRTSLAGLQDGSVSIEGIWASTHDSTYFIAHLAGSNEPHMVLTLPAANGNIGDKGYAHFGTYESFAVSGPVDDIVSYTASSKADGSRPEPVQLITPITHEMSVTGSSAVTDYAASSVGSAGAAYLRVSLMTGTAPTVAVTVYHSSDNFVANSTVLATFTTATQNSNSTNFQRVAFSTACKRYVKVKWVKGGTPTNIQADVSLYRRA